MPIQAQGIQWSTPFSLSDSPSGSWHPAITSDAWGLVHVAWSEDFSGMDATVGDTICYARWDGDAWQGPVDVLAVPGEGVADYPALAADGEGRLHMVWTGQSNFYYSSAPVWDAHRATAWSPPMVVGGDSARSMLESDILAAKEGGLHIVYATRFQNAGVYHIRSDDGGQTWSSPRLISMPLEPGEEGYAAVKIVEDATGRLHVVWQTYQRQGMGQAVYYTRSLTRGESWEKVQQLGWKRADDFEVGWAFVTPRGDSELHLIYVAGEKSTGRWHRISRDGGATWAEPKQIITEMVGVNGYVIPLVDGAEALHLIVNMRPSATQVTGIYYASWDGDGWSPVVPVATEGVYVRDAHRTAATVRLGNEIHIAFFTLAGRRISGDIWHLSGLLPGVQAEQPKALPLVMPMESPYPTAPAEASVTQPTARPMPSQPQVAAVTHRPGLPFLYGVMSSGLVVGLILAAHLGLRRR